MLDYAKLDEKKKREKNHLYLKSEKYSILVNITKKKQTHRYTKQTSGYQCGGGAVPGWGLGGVTYLVLDRLQGCTVQHGGYSQYFVIAINKSTIFKQCIFKK